MTITDDIKRLGEICHIVGYMGAIVDEKYNDGLGSELADVAVTYIAELFIAKRGVPDIVRCKDCMHWYADADTGMACEFTNMGQPEDGFCNW